MLEFTVLIFAALSFSRERELGTLEQLLVMPFKSTEIIIGKAIPAVIISFVDFLLMLVLVTVAFNIPIRGSIPLLLVLAVGYLMVELSKGLLVSVLSSHAAPGLYVCDDAGHDGFYVHRLCSPG